ncbi:5-carboxymethyl-2-hydroxymuconate Delta-isomerase [Streptomyces sp. NPDC000963]|uniref:5-carboxymethyl-2-hydroxymuconate Delta-isomerase n=1 Tax=unclassified Streptomyces TaxID=2593676 RepID=UPI000F7A3981|nr:isomerase [Streptomyces sp. WAC08241]MYV65446.1 isomerase [Streptomyces sp. SID2131]RSS36807.1 isomerase [Streptomyces sp. WAC08241]
MPQIAVDHSAPLDRRGFALALHALVAEQVNTAPGNCKTRFREIAEAVVGDGSGEETLVHVDIAMASGRTDEVKARLSAAILDLLPKHLQTTGEVLLSVEIRDFQASYRRR